MKAVAVVDGEHYPDVVRAALAELPYDFVGVMLVGGSEKLRGAPDYGVPMVTGPGEAEVAIDLSDEPVLDPQTRLHLASRFLADGIAYVGADFRFDPPTMYPFEPPSLAVIGTGKRVGKTAVTGAVARALARDRRVVVVAMGRGGPEKPELVETPPTLDELVELSRSGRHAASDHLETAVLAGVPTIGCRRAGGGMAGAPFTSNVLEGAELAASLDPDVVVFDGSGAAIPPIDVDARILVAHDVVSGLNPYRVLISDVVLTMSEQVAGDVSALGKAAVLFGLRLRPVEPLTGRIALFTTGNVPFAHLGADVVLVSRNLSNRVALAEDLRSVDADTYVVEIKAAAIDMVAEAALERGAKLVFADNEVVPQAGETDLDELFRGLGPSVVRA
ncbi:MAG: cyclic 2,3-diphosphoglycerate synthase [Gaiellaceae bacterium]|nr:cyclic 2,3-diphosphoglycerate synthase [Gaiellaceae bacterium]